MKEIFKIQLVRKRVAFTAFFIAVLVSTTLSFFCAESAFAQSESSIVEIRVGKELRKLFAMSALPETVSIPILSGLGEVTGVTEQKLISVSDKRDLYGVVVPTDGGFFGTVADLSKKNPTYYQLSPGSKVSTSGTSKKSVLLTQEATELKGDELSVSTHCGEESSPDLAPRVAKMVTSYPAKQSWRELELFVVSTSEFSGSRSEESITAQILSTVAAANLFFEPLELKITLTGVQILRAGSDPFSEAVSKLDADEMLKIAVSQYGGKQEIKRDVIAVFGTSNYNRYGITTSNNIFGLAYSKTACTNSNLSVIFATQGSLDVKGELSLSATLAHEIGHTIGMPHDGSLYNGLPSLMSPTFSYNVGGFSDSSIKDYLSYAGEGLPGGVCLSSIPTPTAIAFEGGASETITIKEGDKFTREVKVTGAAASVTPSVLTAGASFDSTTSVFSFQPSFDLANKKTKTRVVTQKLVAKLSDGRQITKEFVFKVADVNRAPQIKGIKVLRGTGIKVSFKVVDLDGDTLTISKETVKSIGRLVGRKNLRFNGNKLEFTWVPSDYHRHTPLSYKITDVGGLSSTLTIRSIS